VVPAQAGLADLYREMGELFGVELHPHNAMEAPRCCAPDGISRPVLIVDEAQEVVVPVLAELRLLSSARLHSHLLLTVVLGGDQRLLERFRSEELLSDDRGKLDGYSRLLLLPRMDRGS
jgi:general secretion pathway protein A